MFYEMLLKTNGSLNLRSNYEYCKTSMKHLTVKHLTEIMSF